MTNTDLKVNHGHGIIWMEYCANLKRWLSGTCYICMRTQVQRLRTHVNVRKVRWLTCNSSLWRWRLEIPRSNWLARLVTWQTLGLMKRLFVHLGDSIRKILDIKLRLLYTPHTHTCPHICKACINTCTLHIHVKMRKEPQSIRRKV